MLYTARRHLKPVSNNLTGSGTGASAGQISEADFKRRDDLLKVDCMSNALSYRCVLLLYVCNALWN